MASPQSHNMSEAMRRYLAEEQQYRAANRKWSKPDRVFKSNAPRLGEPAKGCGADAVYNVKTHVLAEEVKKNARRPSTPFVSKCPQRPEVVLAVEPAVTSAKTIKIPFEKPVNSVNAVMRSVTPRLVTTTPRLADGQHQLRVPKEPRSKSRGVTALLSSRPRLEPPKQPVCDAVYNIDREQKKRQQSRPKSAPWALSTTEQRPKVAAHVDVPPPAKIMTDIAVEIRKKPAAGAAFHSVTPRFTMPRSTTPPAGYYAPKYISHGMIA